MSWNVKDRWSWTGLWQLRVLRAEGNGSSAVESFLSFYFRLLCFVLSVLGSICQLLVSLLFRFVCTWLCLFKAANAFVNGEVFFFAINCGSFLTQGENKVSQPYTLSLGPIISKPSLLPPCIPSIFPLKNSFFLDCFSTRDVIEHLESLFPSLGL